MNRTRLIRTISSRLGLPQSTTAAILGSLLATIKDALAAGDDITLRNFGRFSTRKTPPRRHYDLHSRSIRTSPGRRKITFRPAAKFHDHKGQDIRNTKETVRILAFAGHGIPDLQYLPLLFMQMLEQHIRSKRRHNFYDFTENKCLSALSKEDSITYRLMLKIVTMLRDNIPPKQIITSILSAYNIGKPLGTDLHVTNRKPAAGAHPAKAELPAEDSAVIGRQMFSLARNRRGMEYANIIASQIYCEYRESGTSQSFEQYVRQYCIGRLREQAPHDNYELIPDYIQETPPRTERPRTRKVNTPTGISPRQLLRPVDTEDDNINILLSIFDSLVSYRPRHAADSTDSRPGAPASRRQYTRTTQWNAFKDLIIDKYDNLDRINKSLLYLMMHQVATMRCEGKTKAEITQYLRHLAVHKTTACGSTSSPVITTVSGDSLFDIIYTPEQLELIDISREISKSIGKDLNSHILNIIHEHARYHKDTDFRQYCLDIALEGKIATDRKEQYRYLREILTAFSRKEDKDWIVSSVVATSHKPQPLRDKAPQAPAPQPEQPRTAAPDKKKSLVRHYLRLFRQSPSQPDAAIFETCRHIDRMYLGNSNLRDLTGLVCTLFAQRDSAPETRTLRSHIALKEIMASPKDRQRYAVISQIADLTSKGQDPLSAARQIADGFRPHRPQKQAPAVQDQDKKQYTRTVNRIRKESADITTPDRLARYFTILKTTGTVTVVRKHGIYGLYRTDPDGTVTPAAPVHFRNIHYISDTKWKLDAWSMSFYYYPHYGLLCHLKTDTDTYSICTSENPRAMHLFFGDRLVATDTVIRNVRNDDLFAFGNGRRFKLVKILKSGKIHEFSQEYPYDLITTGITSAQIVLMRGRTTETMTIP